MKNLFFLLPVVLFCGCSSFEEEVLPAESESSRQLSVSEVEEPGPDPSSMDIMRRAVDSVAFRSRNRSAMVLGSQIEPTHRYVRFSPATKAQFDALFDQDAFTCYNFPLDEPSPVTPEEGFRMSTPTDTPEQLYAVLRTTIELPDTIVWEVMKELYDPAVTERGVANPTWAEQVKAQARALADDDRHPGDVFPWYPSGEIKAWDNIANDYVPIEGVAITIMKPGDLLSPLTAKTGKDGKFKSIRNIQGAVNYYLTWNNSTWVIKSSAISSTNLQSAVLSDPWNLRIANGSAALIPATIYRAAYRYWKKPASHGLTPPNYGRLMRFICHNISPYDSGNQGLLDTSPNLSKEEPDIQIWYKNIKISEIFATVAHEIGHAAHFTYNEPYFHKVNPFIKESWARFAEWIVTDAEYRELGLYDKLHAHWIRRSGTQIIGTYQIPDNLNLQNWYLDNDNTWYGYYRIYSTLFIDLYDDFNQHEWYSTIQFIKDPRAKVNANLNMTPDDDICIPNVQEIQAIAFGSKNKAEAIGWIRQYAARYGYSPQTIDRFWRIFSQVEREDSY